MPRGLRNWQHLWIDGTKKWYNTTFTKGQSNMPDGDMNINPKWISLDNDIQLTLHTANDDPASIVITTNDKTNDKSGQFKFDSSTISSTHCKPGSGTDCHVEVKGGTPQGGAIWENVDAFDIIEMPTRQECALRGSWKKGDPPDDCIGPGRYSRYDTQQEIQKICLADYGRATHRKVCDDWAAYKDADTTTQRRKYMQTHCDATNFDDPLCRPFQDNKHEFHDIYLKNMTTHCTKDVFHKDCHAFCKSMQDDPTYNCDTILNKACSDKVQHAETVEDVNTILAYPVPDTTEEDGDTYGNYCGCHLPQKTYDQFIDERNKVLKKYDAQQTGINNDPRCIFEPCQLSNAIWKQGGSAVTCPSVQICINDVDIEQARAKNISFQLTNDCTDVTGDGDGSSGDDSDARGGGDGSSGGDGDGDGDGRGDGDGDARGGGDGGGDGVSNKPRKNGIAIAIFAIAIFAIAIAIAICLGELIHLTLPYLTRR